MAMEKFIFNYTDGTTHANELKVWFETNASEYFDSVNITDTTVECMIDGKIAIDFDCASGLTVYLYSYTGTQIYRWVNSSSEYIREIIKTGYGIALRYGLTTNNWLFITKSNHGDVSFIYSAASSGVSQEPWTFNGAYVGAHTFSDKHTTQLRKALNGDVITDLTVICPICIPYSQGSYTPNCCVTPFTNAKGTTCILEVGGDEYFYNGYAALKI